MRILLQLNDNIWSATCSDLTKSPTGTGGSEFVAIARLSTAMLLSADPQTANEVRHMDRTTFTVRYAQESDYKIDSIVQLTGHPEDLEHFNIHGIEQGTRGIITDIITYDAPLTNKHGGTLIVKFDGIEKVVFIPRDFVEAICEEAVFNLF